MHNDDVPTFLAHSYASNTFTAQDLYYGQQGSLNNLKQSSGIIPQAIKRTDLTLTDILRNANALSATKEESTIMATVRIVKVYIADTNDNLPLDRRVLYRGDEHLTDSTDQELFYEIGVADILEKHNAERVKTTDKAQSTKFGRDIFLEPVKIRDLKMVVTTVATF